jgi:MFS family permease
MREKTADETARTTVPEACPSRDDRDVVNLPVVARLQNLPFVARQLKTPGPVRFLLSGSPAFRILMAGSLISMLGSRISTVAFPMLVLDLYNSPFFTGLVAFAAIAPSMLAYVPAGVLVDRWNPRRVMLFSELLRGLTVASVVIALLVFGGRVNIAFLILAMVAEEILEIFSVLAERRYLSGLMEREKIASRQAYIEVRAHAVVLAGRPIGPFLFGLQPILPFLADMVSFIASITSLLVVRRNDEPVRARQRLSLRQLTEDIIEGLSWLRNDRRSWITIILMAATSLVAQALILMLLAQAHDRHLSTIAIGIVLAASGAGGAVGSLCFRLLPDGLRGFWLPIQMLLWSVTLALLWTAGGLPAAWSAVAMFVLGFSGAIGNIEFGSYLVSRVADNMIAKVTAIGQMLAIGSCALGPVLGGYVIQRYGAKDAVVVLCVIVLLLLLFSLAIPEVSQKLAPALRPIGQILALERPREILSRELAAAPSQVADDAADHRDELPNSVSGRMPKVRGECVAVLSRKVSSFPLIENSRLRSTTSNRPLTSGNIKMKSIVALFIMCGISWIVDAREESGRLRRK